MNNLITKKWTLLLALLFVGWSAWSQGNTINFEGTNQYIDCGAATELNITENLTMEAWVKPNNIAWNPVMGKGDGNGYGMQLNSDGAIVFLMNNGYRLTTDNNTYTAGRWQHIALTFNNTTDIVRCFYNGKLVKETYYTGTYNAANGNFLIGQQNSFLYFDGQIDELRIWYTERTEEEIQANMYNVIANPSSETSLKAYYQFNETTGTTLADQSANSNNGTLTNMAGSEWAESYAMVVPIPTEATDNVGTVFTANWTAPEIGTVEGYILDVSENADFSTFVSGYEELNVGDVLSYDVTGLTEGNTYYYRVRAEKSSVTGTGGIYRDNIEVVLLPAAQPMQLAFNTTEDNQNIELPLHGTVDCTVDWGDGSPTESFYSGGDRYHNFATAGTYTVTISGSLTSFGGGIEWNGVEYLTEVVSFGDIGLTELIGAFINADNLTSVPATLPATVTNLYSAFTDIDQSSITNLDLWNVSNVTNMEKMFKNATNFNQDISSWGVSNVTNMSGMFLGATAFNQNIGNWNVGNVTTMASMFNNASSFNQDISNWDVSSVTDMSSMFIGVVAFNQDINNWNVSNVTSMSSMFNGASVFNGNIESWNVSNVTNMSSMFSWATAFNQNIENWNVGNVTNMRYMFSGASSFNQNIDTKVINAGQTDEYTAWNVGNVTDMYGMFMYASVFNQNIGNWDVSNVTNMSAMFTSASVFNGNIGAWDVSSVTDMSHMFMSAAAFNQYIGNWNVSNVTTMYNMFYGASVFDQDISEKIVNAGQPDEYTAWNVSNVTTMHTMFIIAENFNQNIGNWDVSNVEDMYGMFDRAFAFNGNIGSWDVSSVTTMETMFFRASAFNQDISNWNVSSVTTMRNMFSSATSFDQNIGNWDITSVTNMALMFQNVTLSSAIYDAILTSWAAQTVQPNVNFHGGNSMYSCGTAADARQSLIDNHNWTITDGGYIDNTAPETPTLTTLTDECSITATAPTTEDACAGTITGTTSDPLEYTEQGTYIITWNFDDGNGNSIDVEQTVVVEDVTNPTITCVENMEVDADETHTYVVSGNEFDPTATDDNCEVESVVNDFNSMATLAGATLPEGTTTIVWTVTDVAGNQTTCEYDVLVNDFVGINDLSDLGINIYPNPTTGIFNIETQGNYDVTITDISGKTILTIQQFNNSTIDLSNQPNGVYFIKLQNNDIVKTVKIIKQ